MKTGNRALATRCPACGTVFRVVPDQLRVSDGWVRCGRCTEVFNAPETLVDMDTGTPQRLPEPERQNLMARLEAPARVELDFATPAPTPDPLAPPAAETSAEAAQSRAEDAVPEPGPAPARMHESLPDPRAEPDDRPMPSFVRQAERAARWRRPRVRLALGAGAGAAALVLAAQIVFTYRDLAAARWPAMQPVLAQACAALGCKLGAPRIIEGLAVQSSGLSRVESSDLYRLAVTLRNRADIDLALPAIELTLTNSQGRLMSRRALPLSELAQTPGQAPDRLSAGRELVLQTTLRVAGAPETEAVAGYTIELYYP